MENSGSSVELEFLDISRKELLAEGGTSFVYVLDDEHVVKIYKKFIPLDAIIKENYITKLMKEQGVPTIECGAIVNTNKGYGMILGRTKARNISQLVTRNPEKLDEYVKGYIEVLDTLANCKIPEDKLLSERQHCLNRVELIKNHISRAQYEAMIKLAEAIPDHRGIIHGDLHTRNVRCDDNGNMLVIDLADAKRGPSEYEIACIYQYVLCEKKLPAFNFCKQFTKLDRKKYIAFWNKLIRAYSGLSDGEELKAYEEKIQKISIFSIMLTATDRGNNFIRFMSPLFRYYIGKKIIPNMDEYLEIFRNMK